MLPPDAATSCWARSLSLENGRPGAPPMSATRRADRGGARRRSRGRDSPGGRHAGKVFWPALVVISRPRPRRRAGRSGSRSDSWRAPAFTTRGARRGRHLRHRSKQVRAISMPFELHGRRVETPSLTAVRALALLSTSFGRLTMNKSRIGLAAVIFVCAGVGAGTACTVHSYSSPPPGSSAAPTATPAPTPAPTTTATSDAAPSRLDL
jgi:hypothetical protein